MSSRPKMKGVVYFVLKNINAGAIKRVLNSYDDAMCFYLPWIKNTFTGMR